ncbi:folate-sensitive fragile site protein Fra10Ac1-domain-containing protein [Lentinula raphanica]|uniref:Folate-sensitive fragile site protein Fra10Ac1-domain-containing protein n=1 Tax=Lentinula raphanica TaxID=153919 RepID=A0AA38UKK1_9AGAR|nr:folate-sensitive fragile site protein Fra10Ac1-domain-containing protein [Lentinula raphanica]
MASSSYPESSRSLTTPQGKTEFEILQASHKFLREETDDDESQLGWEERLALKYYTSLYREFAVCDLKHYKSGNFALRWRTEDEVLDGTGESTCGNTRCKFYNRGRAKDHKPPLSTLELPFAYSEHGENKSALVKVVLCAKCVDKLMWKRRQGKGGMEELDQSLQAQEQDGAKVKEEELDGLDGVSVSERQKHRSHRQNDSKDANERSNRWNKEDVGRKMDSHWTRSSRSRSPGPHVVRKRSRHR